MIAISPEKAKYLRETVEKHRMSFDLLSDAGNQIARRYGLVYTVGADLRKVYLHKWGIDLPKFNGDDSWTLPIPARFVIDQTGQIRWTQADPDYTRRPEPAETVEALQALPNS